MSGDARDDDPEGIAIDREVVRRGGLEAFVELAWHIVEPSSDYLTNWHVGVICKQLERVTRCEVRDLAINIPPGCMKSLLVSVFWPAWDAIEKHGKTSWIFASFDNALSLRDSLRTKSLIDSDWFQSRWGTVVRVLESGKSNSASEWYTTTNGMRYSTSVRGRGTGRHADVIVVDDPIKPVDVDGAALSTVTDWWSGTLASRRKNPSTTRRVIIMQRLHDLDLVGHVLKSGGWEHVRLPMEFEAADACEHDRRTTEGELLWPSRFPRAEVDAIKGPRGLGATNYTTQYQQRPQPRGGTVFRREWFNSRYRELPSGATMIQSWDCAFKSSDDSSFVVGGVWARGGADYYLVDVVRARMDMPTTVHAIRDLSRRHPRARTILIEDKANGPAIIQTLRHELSGIVAHNPGSGSKESRASAVAPYFEAGNVHMPASELDAPWLAEYIDEMTRFPRGAHDDQVDMTSQALLKLSGKSKQNYRAAMDAVRASG